MSGSDLKNARLQVDTQKQEFMAEWTKYQEELKKLAETKAGILTEDFASMLVITPQLNDLRYKIITKMGNLIEAYDEYTKLLEEKS